jgi:hypothetical protein
MNTTLCNISSKFFKLLNVNIIIPKCYEDNPKVMTGEKFKEKYPNYKPMKILNTKMKHYGYQYKIGINIDILPFNPTGENSAGGLYFTNEENIHRFIDYGENVAYINILNNSLIYLESDRKYKADRFEITKIISLEEYINNSSDEIKLNIIKYY